MTNDRLIRAVAGINPSRTSLFLGAGSSRSSGAPLAAELCRHLEGALAQGAQVSDDLSELASILESRTSRQDLVNCIVRKLEPLHPDGALLALAKYSWRSIYTTNYDCLVERAYAKNAIALPVVRSNFDWDAGHQPGTTTLFKLHGCITQDRAFGHKASMTITAADYVEHERYREMLFAKLALDMASGPVWIVGYSMRDAHLKAVVDRAIRLQRESGAPGRILLLVYEYDDGRAAMWRSLGVHDVIQGDINSFAQAVANTVEAVTSPAQAVPPHGLELPTKLAPCTITVSSAGGPSNPRRLFYGGAATYADIDAGLTFERDTEGMLEDSTKLVRVVTGVAGTGKTTVARRLVKKLAQVAVNECYEHRETFPLQPDLWLEVERRAAAAGRQAILLVDNCPPFQRQVNEIVRRAPLNGALRIIVTAETSAWIPRQKDPRFFSEATSVELSRLSDKEVRLLREAVTKQPSLRSLVSSEMLRLSPREQETALRRRCGADMFVCLKALFSSESLDDILLKEYGAIEEAFRDVYRVTAALDSKQAKITGAKRLEPSVHAAA